MAGLPVNFPVVEEGFGVDASCVGAEWVDVGVDASCVGV